jgi:hypothetical protein
MNVKKTSGSQTANYPTEPEEVRKRIEFVLSMYPRLSYTMLQVGLGTGYKPFYWRPVLQEMIADGTVRQWEEMRNGPTGRYNVYTFLALSKDRQAELEAVPATASANDAQAQ